MFNNLFVLFFLQAVLSSKDILFSLLSFRLLPLRGNNSFMLAKRTLVLVAYVGIVLDVVGRILSFFELADLYKKLFYFMFIISHDLNEGIVEC